MAAGTLAFSLGIWFCLQWRVLPDPVWIGFLPALALLARDRCWRLPGLFLIGLLWAQLHAALGLQARLPVSLEGRDLRVVGVVSGVPRRQGDSQRFELILEQADPGWQTPEWRRCRLRLTWHRHRQPIQAGTRWRFQVRLKRPHGSHNHPGPDSELRALRQGICATGYIRESKVRPRQLAPAGFKSLLAVRQNLTRIIRERLAGFPSQGIITALVTGVRDDISDDQRRLLQATGTAHLVAISGLHIGLLAGFGYLLGRFALLLLPWLYPRLRPGAPEAALALLLAAAYAALAGFSLPTQRALIMLLVVLLAQALGRRPAGTHGLCCALILVLILDPLAILSAGLWLSFIAVAGLLYGFSDRRRLRRPGPGSWFGDLTRVQWLAWVTLLPVSLYWFGGIALSSPAANLLAVPVTGLLVVPLALLGVLSEVLRLPVLAGALLELSATAMDLLLLALGAIEAQVPLLRLPVPAAEVAIFAGLGSVLLLLSPRSLGLRWLGWVWLLPLVLPPAAAPGPGTLWLTVFDVGQGLAVLVRTRDHSLVYDSGAGFAGGWNAGERILVPGLYRRGVRRLDRLVLSHRHLDHIGGAGGLAAGMEVERLISNVPARLLPVAARRLAREPCRAGARWRWDGYEFQVLSPGANTPKRSSVNNRSCVLRISGPGGGVLLSGDLERQGEAALLRAGLEDNPRTLESAVLQSPHHGSRTSSSRAFLRAVNPRWIIISRGYRNRFGFPHRQVLERYRELGARVLDSVCEGVLDLRLGPGHDSITVTAWRQRRLRFWHVLEDGRCLWYGQRGFVKVAG